MKTLADMWREEGIEQGLEQGLEKGIRIGLIEKFKKIPIDISEGIKKLDTPALKVIVRKIMSEEGLKNLDDVREFL